MVRCVMCEMLGEMKRISFSLKSSSLSSCSEYTSCREGREGVEWEEEWKESGMRGGERKVIKWRH